MCFGLAPGYIVEDDLEADLEAALAAETETTDDDSTPAFAREDTADGTALTGRAAGTADRDGSD